jgi:LysR family glycine cleavage system transcriptional activator
VRCLHRFLGLDDRFVGLNDGDAPPTSASGRIIDRRPPPKQGNAMRPDNEFNSQSPDRRIDRVLPPLSALRAFEAAARHRNFTMAAQELNVTPSAVSHQMRQLERWLGVALFFRKSRPLRLTDAGQAYFEGVGASFDALAQLTRAIATARRPTALTVSTMDSFAAAWLVPRLPRFRAEHPKIDVRVSTCDRFVDFAREDVDLAIRYGDGGWTGCFRELLFEDILLPVCSPALAQGPPPLLNPADLRRHTLLHDAASFGWVDWLAQEGVARLLDPQRGMSFSHTYLMLQAAIGGQGVGLASAPLVQDAISEGLLAVPPLTPGRGKGAYYLVMPEEAVDQPKTAAFLTWLRAERDRQPAHPVKTPTRR